MNDPATDLAARLRGRLPEIEAACLREVYAIADAGLVAEPLYQEGLRLAVAAALEYGLTAVETPGEASPVPGPLLTQARSAARADVSLDTVIRRCCAGDALLRRCLIEEAQKAGLESSVLERLLRSQQISFDRLLEAVGVEHRRTLEVRLDPTERHAKGIERLLAGEALDTTEIPYEFDAHHVAAIVAGGVKAEEVRSLGKALNRRVLIVAPREGMIWAWFGGRQALDPRKLGRCVFARKWPAEVSVAVGEPSYGLSGWRHSHRQARAALTIARRSSHSTSRYADVAILSTLIDDDLLVSSLNQLYIAPLEKRSDRGATLRETLRAFFACERNVSSAAATLGVKRHTVTRRLRTVEEILGQPLSECATALDLALSLEELSAVQAHTIPSGD